MSAKQANVAVVGATGNVGREILNILAERKFPIGNIYALASQRSVGKEISFGMERILKAENLDGFDFSKVDIVLSSAGSSVSQQFVPIATKAGAVVIDNTSFYRMDKDVPLVVTEVNPEAIAEYKKKGVIANPNCAVMQLAVALKPLHDRVAIKRVVLSTYQSVSGAGKAAMDELYEQTKAKLTFQKPKIKKLSKEIAFNLIPQIDSFMDNGYTKEEWKITEEIKKIMDPSIQLTATCVRVPVFVGHSEAVNVEFEGKISASEAKSILTKAEGVVLESKNDQYTTPLDIVKTDKVYVSRIRDDLSQANTLNMWVVADNLRKGAALNAVQIAELLIKRDDFQG